MLEAPERKYLIETRLEEYRTIFSHSWAKSALSVTEGTKLGPPMMALCASWRAAANTHSMPWMMVHSLSGLWNGAAKQTCLSSQLISAISTAIPKKMAGKTSHMQQKKIAQAVREIADDVQRAVDADTDPDMEPEAFWRQFTEDRQCWEFNMAVWGSQQLVFGALFFAFEHYVASLVGIGNPSSKDSPNWDDLIKDAKKLFDSIDPTLVKGCMEDEFVKITRLTRHCIAHRGGRVSETLKRTDHGIPILDGIVQIMAPHNANCIRGLEQRVLKLTQAAVTIPEYRL